MNTPSSFLPSSSATSTSTLMSLPQELFTQIDSYLPVEDSHNFKQTHASIDEALNGNFQHYDKMHVSDDASECKITDSRGKCVPRSFSSRNTAQLIEMLPNLKDITVIMKDVNVRGRHVHFPARKITDCNPYTPGGFLVQILGQIPKETLTIRQLSVHVDIMIENLRDVFLQCPSEDLKYAMNHLTNVSFNSFIQISICCAQIRPDDVIARNYLLQGMQYALKTAADSGAKTEFVVEPCEGYVDMTIEMGNVEYSFAFFYYNPTICDPTPDDAPPTIPLMTNYCL